MRRAQGFQAVFERISRGKDAPCAQKQQPTLQDASGLKFPGLMLGSLVVWLYVEGKKTEFWLLHRSGSAHLVT